MARRDPRRRWSWFRHWHLDDGELVLPGRPRRGSPALGLRPAGAVLRGQTVRIVLPWEAFGPAGEWELDARLSDREGRPDVGVVVTLSGSCLERAREAREAAPGLAHPDRTLFRDPRVQLARGIRHVDPCRRERELLRQLAGALAAEPALRPRLDDLEWQGDLVAHLQWGHLPPARLRP